MAAAPQSPAKTSSNITPTRSTPHPHPYEPGGLLPGIPSQAPIITLMPGPVMQRRNRRKFLAMLGLSVVAGSVGARAVLQSWRARLAEERPKRSATARALNTPARSSSTRGPSSVHVPLLLLLDDARRGDRLCARSRRCREHRLESALRATLSGAAPRPTIPGAASTFLDAVRAQANVDGSRPAIAGYGTAADAACRLALASNIFAEAVLEFPGRRGAVA